MSKRVRITNDSLNSYGTRVLTAGMNTEQYNRNPVLLYMHERGNVIGYVKDLKVENDEVTGELMFDCASELSKRCKKQWEFGSLKMVSAGLDILELSEDPEHLVQGQTRPTITRSKLFEVSLVDVGANDDAIVLKRNGVTVEMGKGGGCGLPLLKAGCFMSGACDGAGMKRDEENGKPENAPDNDNNPKKGKEMDKEKIALQLGLAKEATEAEISAKLEAMKASVAESEKREKELEELKLKGIETAVEQAIKEQRLDAGKKDDYVQLGKAIGMVQLQKILGDMRPRVALSGMLHGGHGGSGRQEWKKLSDVPGEELLKLRSENVEEYKRLYEAEYGVKCEIDL